MCSILKFFAVVVCALSFAVPATPAVRAEDTALKIFEKRIVPILHAKRPSSCTQCHLSGVELKDYIFPEQDKTFAALVRGGLIDTRHPSQSKLLAFIARKPAQANLITDKVRAEETAAFKAWIEAAVKDPQLLKTQARANSIGPALSPEVIRHARRDRVLQSFVDNVWLEISRCAGCHSPDRNQQQVKKHGEQISWIKPRDPAATLQGLLDSGNIDVDAPHRSPLITKPTLQVPHGGGQKAVVGDRTYKQFIAFLDDYSATAKGTYKDAKSLPQPLAELSFGSDLWFKIEGIPAQFDKQLLRAEIYTRSGQQWSATPVAVGDRQVAGDRNLWQQHLSLLAPRGSKRAEELQQRLQLPAGKYLAKILIDQTGRLQQDPTSDLTAADVIATVEFESKWSVGYGAMTVIKFPRQ